MQYFKVLTKNRPAPLNIHIQRSGGKVESYLSCVVSAPSLFSHEIFFTGDNFKLERDTGAFVESACYICLKALGDCRLAIKCSFGHERAIKTIVH